ncbi:MAG: ThiF family adenylyltransferase [Acidobacteriota bacterium]
MTTGIEVRIPGHLWGRLWEEVRRPGPREPVVFGLVSHAQTLNRTLLLVRDVIVPPTTAFVESKAHGAKWTGAYNISLLNEALERGLGILIFHYHSGTAQVRMSEDDKTSARQLLSAFQMVAPGRPHGSVVLGDCSAGGLILVPGTSRISKNFRLRFFSDEMTTFPILAANAADLLSHQSQPLLEGKVTRSKLANLVVAVVGLSGGGTQVARHLACQGVGELIGIDAQRVTRDNLLATGEFGWLDILLRRRKTSVVRSQVWWINRHVRFTAVNAFVPEPPTIAALKRADLIVGCVNNLNARADLQEIAWRYCIPYVDVGLGLYPLNPNDELSEIGAISGNLFVALPGGACLWCTGFLSDEKIQLEAGGDRSYLRTKLARSRQNSAAYVASFNGVLASLAASDVLQLSLDYASTIAVRKQFDALSGAVSEVVVKKNPHCPKCSSVLAAGDPLWQ